mmetsp:Transcript_25479/g.49946  ORF Transcript_25479/g.49946 Transcript_25479/m.49946 type:complete len:356 (-) Transcript_25479:185-1252(-)
MKVRRNLSSASEYSSLSKEMPEAGEEEDEHINPSDWMAAFGHVPCPNLAIPGSHDSGAQNLNCCNTGPDWKQARYFLPLGCCVVLPWSAAQGQSAGELMEEGCRYFDLRVGIDDSVQNEEDEYKLCHGFFSRNTLRHFLDEIRMFLDEHATEVVVLEVKTVHSFDDDGVSLEEHDNLIAFLEEHLGGKDKFVNEQNLMRPIGELTAEGKQIYLVYASGGCNHEKAPVDKHLDTLLNCLNLRSKWPKKCEPDGVCEFLTQELCEQADACHNKFLVLQGVMTPEAKHMVFGTVCCLLFDHSLRNFAHRLEPALQEVMENCPVDQLAHGAILMIDWLQDQPDLVSHVIGTNYKLHPTN